MEAGGRLTQEPATPNLQNSTDVTYEPDGEWHTYRLEMQGNIVRLLIDGAVVAETTDNQHLQGGQVGLAATRVQINVRSFRVIAL